MHKKKTKKKWMGPPEPTGGTQPYVFWCVFFFCVFSCVCCGLVGWAGGLGWWAGLVSWAGGLAWRDWTSGLGRRPGWRVFFFMNKGGERVCF